jgi:cyclophilin family peptidyl-prolyl cis-trans isomerase
LHLVEQTGLKDLAFTSGGKAASFISGEPDIKDDGFQNKRKIEIPPATGKVGYCKKSTTFSIVTADSSSKGCFQRSVGEVSTGVRAFTNPGKFLKCTIPAARVSCSTTKGDLKLLVHPYWAPIGAARFLTLVERGFYTDIFLWRVNGAIIQFGADEKDARPEFNDIRDIEIADDAHIKEANPASGLPKYRMAHAGAPVPNSRDVGIFFVTGPNPHLGEERWEGGFADVVEGQKVVDSVYGGYGEGVDVQLLYGNSKGFKKKYSKIDTLSCWLDETGKVPKPRKRRRLHKRRRIST